MDGSEDKRLAPICALDAQMGAENGSLVRKKRRHTLANQVSSPEFPYAAVNICLSQALDYLEPRDFRGRPRVLVKLMPRDVAYNTVWEWITGRRRLPADIARAMAVLVGDRAREGLRIEADLLAYAEWRESIPRPRAGAMAVDPETGLSKRGSWKR